MHVIPVPVMEVKEDLPGYLMRPIRYLIGITSGNKAKHGERRSCSPRFQLRRPPDYYQPGHGAAVPGGLSVRCRRWSGSTG